MASDLKDLGKTHTTVAYRHNTLGKAWHEKGEYDKAIEYYQQAIDIGKQTLEDDHSDMKAYLDNLARAIKKQPLSL